MSNEELSWFIIIMIAAAIQAFKYVILPAILIYAAYRFGKWKQTKDDDEA